MIIESHIGGSEGREMGRFVRGQDFSQRNIDGQVCTLLHASAMTKEIRLVCVVCVLCACVHYMYMYLHIYSGFKWSAGIISVDSFSTFWGFHVRYLSYLMYMYV